MTDSLKFENQAPQPFRSVGSTKLCFVSGQRESGILRLLPEGSYRIIDTFDIREGKEPFGFAAVGIANQTRSGLKRFLQSNVPQEVLDGARSGRISLILDNSGEANRIPDRVFDDWYSALSDLGIKASLVSYLSQDIRLSDLHSVYLRKNPQKFPINILYHHSFLKRFVDKVNSICPDESAFQDRELSFINRGVPEKRALCLMYKIRPRRIQLALSLLKEGMWEDSAISFGGLDFDDVRRQRQLEKFGRTPNGALDEFRTFRNTENLETFLPQLKNKGRVLLGAEDPEKLGQPIGSPEIVLDLSEDLHRATRFSLVSETEMGNRMCRFTEKSFKPLASYHPMINFGNPGTITMLRSLGFKSFHNIINESYDDITQPDRRFEVAFSETKRLWLMSEQEWNSCYEKVLDTLKYNAWHLFFGLSHVIHSTMDVPLFNSLRLIQMQAMKENIDCSHEQAEIGGVSLIGEKNQRNLVIVGFPKCGTSALMRAFEADTDVSVIRTPDGKLEIPWPMFRDMALNKESDQLKVHKFTAYIYNLNALKFLSEDSLNNHFVLCIRDPRKSLVSWHNMHKKIAQSGKNRSHFAYIERDFYSNCSVEAYYKKYAAKNLRYDEYFLSLLSIVGKERLTVVSQECMARNMESVVSFLKERSPQALERFCSTEGVSSKVHTGFADLSSALLNKEIDAELRMVYETLLYEIEKSGVRTCL